MPIHPEVLWAQRSSEVEEEKNVLYLTVNLTDVIPDSLKLELKPTSISFEARAGDNAKGIEEKEYAFHFDLFKEIVPGKSKQNLTSRHLALTLQKAEKAAEYWPRLTKEKLKTPFLKTDFSRWVDEDEQDGAPAAAEEDEMGGMGDMAGMGGMGGMGGMPGMGGMGGMPGMGGMGGGPGGMGGMDLQKMLAEMNASGAGGGGEPSGSGVAGEEEEGDSDDDGPPPLEDAPAVSSSS